MSADALQSFQSFLDDLKRQLKAVTPDDPNRMVQVPVKVLTASLDLIGLYRTQNKMLQESKPDDSFLKFINRIGERGVDGLEKSIKLCLDTPVA